MEHHACKNTRSLIRHILLPTLLLMSLPACTKEQSPATASSSGEQIQATLSIDASKSQPVNRLLLGNNVQWVDRGDELLKPDSLTFRDDKLALLKMVGATVLRYPGGSLSDLYQWEEGIGPLSRRGVNKRFHGDGSDKILFGTSEFLSLSRYFNAEPLITVNLITAKPSDAAAWVKAVNIDGMQDAQGKLPTVKYWEIGNEPYLIDDNQKKLAIQPAEFAKRVNRTIRRMKAVDPSIKVGIPLRSDKLAGIPATPLPGYNKTVLSEVNAPFDFVSVHNAYYPFIYDKVPSSDEIYLASMAATDIVRENLAQTRKELARYGHSSDTPIAITEYSSMFTIGKGETDAYISSLLGGLYIADLLIELSRQDNILMANHWSLSGNWEFGTIDQKGVPRAALHVLAGLNLVFNGEQLNVTIDSPAFNSSLVGFAPARKNIPYINAMVTRFSGQTHVVILNKHPDSAASIRIEGLPEVQGKGYFINTLYIDDVFTADTHKHGLEWKESAVKSFSKSGRVSVPAHSLSIFSMK